MHGKCKRVACTATLSLSLAACTQGVPMDRRFAVAQHEFYDDTMRLRLTDGDELTTSRMTVSDTTVVVYALKRRWRSDELDTPLVIRARDVESIEHVEIDWSNTVAAVLALELTVFATIILLGN